MDEALDPGCSLHESRLSTVSRRLFDLHLRVLGTFLVLRLRSLYLNCPHANEHPTGKQANEKHPVSSAGSPIHMRMCTQYAISATARSGKCSRTSERKIPWRAFRLSSKESLHLSDHVCQWRCRLVQSLAVERNAISRMTCFKLYSARVLVGVGSAFQSQDMTRARLDGSKIAKAKTVRPPHIDRRMNRHLQGS